MPVRTIVDRVLSLKVHHVTVTGGEPLCQEGCVPLMDELVAQGVPVQLETNGSLPLDRVPAGARIISDVKTPSSGEEQSFLLENLRCLGRDSEVKFVIADEKDYIFANNFMERYLHDSVAVVNLSPAHGAMPPARLAAMMLRDGLKARMNLQLHKIIWGESEKKIVL
jgi:7-carboxy-7-deazaguanine synthase